VLDCCLTKKKKDMKIQKRLLIEVPKTKNAAAAVNNDKKTNFENGNSFRKNSLDKKYPPLPICPPKTLSNHFSIITITY